jgi:cell division protein ZapA (FtsZ GTPase activity inhibitor)
LDKTVTLQILGRKFTFRTKSGIPDAKKVAAHFEDAVKKVQAQFADKQANVDKETILVLTGLNIASENHLLQKQCVDVIERMTEKSAVVLRELEKAIS